MARQRTASTIAAVYGGEQDQYLELVRRFPLRPLRTAADLAAAVEILDSLLDRDDLSAAEQDYLDVLGDLVEAYEEAAVPVRRLDDAEMLRFLIANRGATQAEVAAGAKVAESTVSEVLSGKRKLNRAQIGKLARYFHVEPGVFAFPG
jgi:HTH-type transcriptional regulator/antitoxin HigA